MRYTTQALLGMMVVAALLKAPVAAEAIPPLEGGGLPPLLGFGASYVVGTSTSVHHGLDLSGQAGESVRAPLAGKVTFVGRVPGAGGETSLAITLLTDSGSITLLPLDRASVSRGDDVVEGESIATLASAGDASSSATHLHIGLRKGTLYLDPTPIVAAPAVSASSPQGEPAEASAPAADGAATAPMPAATGVGAYKGAGAPAGGSVGAAPVDVRATGVTAGAPTGSSARAAAGSPESAVRGMSGGELAPGVSLAAGSPVLAPVSASNVFTDAQRAVATGGELVRAASSAANDGRFAALVSRGVAAARRSASAALLLAMGVLCALGALWPLWHEGGLEGAGKLSVSAVGEDVAAVASR